jgi:hypothetical protein
VSRTRKTWGPVSAKAWPPPHEVYCGGCRRMVAATPDGVPETHHRFTINRDPHSGMDRFTQCAGGQVFPDMVPGMEDPRARFSGEPRSWMFRHTDARFHIDFGT